MADERPRILVVDDESDSLLYLFDLLSAQGFRVEGSSSALDTVEYVKRWSPAVVISDVRMPEMDGLELLGRIKDVSPKTRVILLSAFGDDRMRQETIGKGGEALLTKPLTHGALFRVLDRVLEGNAR